MVTNNFNSMKLRVSVICMVTDELDRSTTGLDVPVYVKVGRCGCVCVCVTHHKPLQVTVTKASLMKTTQKLNTPPSSMVYVIAPSVHQLSTVLQLSALETLLVVV